MITTLALLLQAAASLLTGIGQNNSVSYAVREQAVVTAEHAIQYATQAEAMPDIVFPVSNNASIWPTVGDLAHAPYRTADGGWVPIGKSVQLVSPSISFGDINNDGFDDAAVVVQRVADDGSADFALAAMIDQGDILFNIADLPLGSSVEVYSHTIENGQILIDMKIGDAAPATYRYELLGNQLVKI